MIIVALVWRHASAAILVRDDDVDPILPSIAVADEPEPTAEDAVRAVEALIGHSIVPLRLATVSADGDLPALLVVDSEPIVDAPAGYRWVDAATAIDALEPASARAVIRRLLERAGSGPVGHAPPWARAGWFARTAAWMLERMGEAGLDPTESPRLVYQGPLAAVLRARTHGRSVFLKCAAPAFATEASITHALFRGTPDRVPSVIASDPAENWLLMHDYGDRPLGDEPESTWPDGLRRVVALQRAWIDSTTEVTAAGGQWRPLSRLVATLPAMLDTGDLGGRLAPEARTAWVAAMPRLLAACDVLGDVGVPDTLVHGDLHPHNIAITPHGPLVVDWSDAAIGHPLLDLAVFLRRTQDRDLRRRLRDAYLEGWDGIAPHERLIDAVTLAMAVGAAYQVATYQALLPAMDAPDRAAFDGADERWLQRALDGLEHGLDAGLT